MFASLNHIDIDFIRPMNIAKLSLKQKLLLLVFTIISLNLIADYMVKQSTNHVSVLFKTFKDYHFKSTLQVEELKQLQTIMMLDIRGLQIAYLLKLSKQIPPYLESIAKVKIQTPDKLQAVKEKFLGDPDIVNVLNQKINFFQDKSTIFIESMKQSPINKAPYPIYKAYYDSYFDMVETFKVVSKQNENLSYDAYIEAQNAMQSADLIFMIATLLSITISLLIIYILSQSMIRNIQNVRLAAIRLSEGELNQKVIVPGNDEISQLSIAINMMIAKLNNILSDIMKMIDNMAVYSERADLANDKIKDSANKTTNYAIQIATAIEELNLTSQEIGRNIDATAALSNEMNKLSIQSMMVYDKMKLSMGLLSDSLLNINTGIQGLAIHFTKVDAATNTIKRDIKRLEKDIHRAQDKNLPLDVNEVTHMTDQVVHDLEIINNTMTDFQENIIQISDYMADGLLKIKDTEKQVNISYDSIEKVNRMTSDVSNQTKFIASGINEQCDVTVETTKNMYTMQELSQSVSNASIEAADSTRMTLESSKNLLRQIKFFRIKKHTN